MDIPVKISTSRRPYWAIIQTRCVRMKLVYPTIGTPLGIGFGTPKVTAQDKCRNKTVEQAPSLGTRLSSVLERPLQNLENARCWKVTNAADDTAKYEHKNISQIEFHRMKNNGSKFDKMHRSAHKVLWNSWQVSQIADTIACSSYASPEKKTAVPFSFQLIPKCELGDLGSSPVFKEMVFFKSMRSMTNAEKRGYKFEKTLKRPKRNRKLAPNRGGFGKFQGSKPAYECASCTRNGRVLKGSRQTIQCYFEDHSGFQVDYTRNNKRLCERLIKGVSCKAQKVDGKEARLQSLVWSGERTRESIRKVFGAGVCPLAPYQMQASCRLGFGPCSTAPMSSTWQKEIGSRGYTKSSPIWMKAHREGTDWIYMKAVPQS